MAKLPHLAAISAFFPFSGPALETTLSSSWDMFGNYKGQLDYILYIRAMPGTAPDLLASFHGDPLFRSTTACSDACQSVRCQGSSSRTEILQGCVCPFHEFRNYKEVHEEQFMNNSVFVAQCRLCQAVGQQELLGLTALACLS